jgi:hypothetical protein
MKFSFKSIIDPSNKLLICEAFGGACEVFDIEHRLKKFVKIACEDQVKNIVLYVTMFFNLCS